MRHNITDYIFPDSINADLALSLIIHVNDGAATSVLPAVCAAFSLSLSRLSRVASKHRLA